MLVQDQIDKLVKCIVDAVHPLQIILFGSAARNEMGPDSDIDVLVVMPNGTHRVETEKQLYRTVKGITTPYDILVSTPEILGRHRFNIGLVYRTILEEGKTIYAFRNDLLISSLLNSHSG
jgi:uncharacterized protein